MAWKFDVFCIACVWQNMMKMHTQETTMRILSIFKHFGRLWGDKHKTQMKKQSIQNNGNSFVLSIVALLNVNGRNYTEPHHLRRQRCKYSKFKRIDANFSHFAQIISLSCIFCLSLSFAISIDYSTFDCSFSLFYSDRLFTIKRWKYHPQYY